MMSIYNKDPIRKMTLEEFREFMKDHGIVLSETPADPPQKCMVILEDGSKVPLEDLTFEQMLYGY